MKKIDWSRTTFRNVRGTYTSRAESHPHHVDTAHYDGLQVIRTGNTAHDARNKLSEALQEYEAMRGDEKTQA